MNVRVLSRTKAVKLSYTDFEESKVIISISDPFNNPARFCRENGSIKEVLYLSFHDISEETKDIFGGYASMTLDDALKIAHFVNKWKDKVDAIWVHCEVGASRSAGIAAAIKEHLGLDSSDILKSNQYYPNMLCYELTKQAFSKVVCNKCGKALDSWDLQEDFSIRRNLGYGTKYDEDTLNLHLCCKCMENLIDECKVSPIIDKDLQETNNDV